MNANMRIVNVIKNGEISNESNYEMLLRFLDQIANSDDQKKANYTLANLDLHNHLSYDMLVDGNDQAICFSGLYKRPASKHVPGWPDGVYRICNRTYMSTAFRSGMYGFQNPNIIGTHQLREHSDVVEFAFISREKPKAEYTFKKMQRSFEFYSDWTLHDKMVQVVPTVEKKSAYHRILYKSYKPNAVSFKTITESEYERLPD